MKKYLFAACLMVALPALADVTAGSVSQAQAGAINSGVTVENQFHTTQPAATAAFVQQSGLPQPAANVQLTTIAPPPSPRTCADTGISAGGGGRSGGISLAFGTGAEVGCDTARDLEMIDWVIRLPEASLQYRVAIQRLCKKPEVQQAFVDAGEGRRCETAEARERRAAAILRGEGDGLGVARRQPKPWEAGG